MSDQNDRLFPCPFCGSDAGVYRPHDHDYSDYPEDKWQPMCSECGCELGCFDTQEEAAMAWNSRVTNMSYMPSKTLAERIAEYTIVVDEHGPDSTEARRQRRLHPGDVGFCDAADAIDRIRRFLGGNNADGA